MRVGSRSHTFYETRWGPVVVRPDATLDWTAETAYALADPNAADFRLTNQWAAWNRSASVADWRRKAARIQGNPWVNSIVADDKGNAYYGDDGAVPNLKPAFLERCGTAKSPLLMSVAGIGVLDGSRRACRLPRDAGAAARGILGPRSLPQTVRRDYTFNSNDSFWLPNADARLEGFPRVLGEERVIVPRTRLAAIMAEQRLAGTDGLGPPGFTLDNLRAMFFSNRHLIGELLRDPLVAACRGGGADLAAACDVLAAWDLRADAASRGAVLFREVWRRLRRPRRPFATPFSKADPLGTPNGLATDRVDVPAAIRAAVQDLQSKGIALDVPLGDLQYEVRGDERLPMSGCPDNEGCFNILTTRRDEQGVYEPYTGSSFVMAAELTDKGPRGQRDPALLAVREPRVRALRRPDAALRAGALAAAALHRAPDPERPGVHAQAGDGPQVSRERPVAVGLVLAAAGSLQVGAAFAVTLFDELGPGGAAFLRLAFAAVVLWAIWRPRLRRATCAWPPRSASRSG